MWIFEFYKFCDASWFRRNQLATGNKTNRVSEIYYLIWHIACCCCCGVVVAVVAWIWIWIWIRIHILGRSPLFKKWTATHLLVPHPGVSRLWGYLRAAPEIVRWIPVLPASGARAAGGKSDCPSEEATKPKRGPRGV